MICPTPKMKNVDFSKKMINFNKTGGGRIENFRLLIP